MIYKLLKFVGFIMLVFTIFMVRKRPGVLFEGMKKKPVVANESQKIQTGSEKKSKNSPPVGNRTLLDHDNMRISFSNLIGDVRVFRDNREVEINIGFKLKFKDRITTGKDSVALIQYAGNSILKLFSESELLVGRVQHPDRSAVNKQFTFFVLNKGAILGDFINRGDMHILEITSEVGKIQVRGTQFLFIYNQAKKRLQTAVLEGVVKLSNSDNSSSQFVASSYGAVLKAHELVSKPSPEGWVEKIDWKKLSQGMGIDLFSPNFTANELMEWRSRRESLKKMPESLAAKNQIDIVKKSKTVGIFNKAISKALQAGKDLAKKGAKSASAVTPLGDINEAAENVKNYEQSQKNRQKALDDLE